MSIYSIRTISTLARVTVLFLITITATVASGQEMEPRAYSPAPVGTQFVVFTYGHQSGDVLGGSTVLNETANDDRQKNSRVGEDQTHAAHNFSNFIGSSLGGGGISINGSTFVGILGGSFEFRGDPIPLPDATSNITVTGPFTFSGFLSVCGSDPCNGPILFTTQLVGSGEVMIDLILNPLHPGGISLYDFRSLTYTFENPAIPEPASLLLLASGLAALGASRKFRFRRRT